MDCWCQAGKASRRRQEKGGLRYGWSIGKEWAGEGGWWGKRPGKQGQSAEEALEGEGRAECPFQGAFIFSNTEKHIPLQAGVDYLLPGDWPANWAAAGHPGWGWGVSLATWGGSAEIHERAEVRVSWRSPFLHSFSKCCGASANGQKPGWNRTQGAEMWSSPP